MSSLPYSKQYIDGSDINEVVKVLKSDWLTQGPKIGEFEAALCRYTGARYAAALSSGTAALHLSLLTLGIGRGDEIITSPITFSASANCAIYVGARPKFIDIDDKTCHMDLDKLKSYLKIPSQRKRVKIVIPVHFMGTVMDIAETRKICDKYGIKVIEDAAHALGAEYKDIKKRFKIGSSSHSAATVLSFHPIKHITTGEGGAILTNNKRVYESAVRLRHHGIVKSKIKLWSYDINQVGYNYRITDFQCALGISQLKKLDSMIKRRRELVRRYNRHLSNINGIRLPYERKETRASYHLYVIRVAKELRNKLYSYLRKNNISTQVNYMPVHLFSYYRRRLNYKRGSFPIAESYSRECLSLPLYAKLSRPDQIRVINKIKEFFQ